LLGADTSFLVVGVLGQKGVGKSTLMNALSGVKADVCTQYVFK